MSPRSLLKQIEDWSKDETISVDNRRLILTYYKDIAEFFLCSKNNEALKTLINHINEHTR